MGVLPGKENEAKPLEQRIKELLSSAPVVLLMKGSPEEPRCGFSRKVVDALQKDSIAFKHFDILQARSSGTTVCIVVALHSVSHIVCCCKCSCMRYVACALPG